MTPSGATFGGAASGGVVAGEGEVVIGVAVALPDPFGDELTRWRAYFGDPLAEAIPPHVTLLPPTTVRCQDMDAARRHLAEVAAREDPFDMLLRGTGTFRPVSPVVFVQVAEGLADCERIERRVRTGVLERDLSFCYHPHVTVAHHVDDAAMDRAFSELAGFTASFRVEAFELFEHGQDGVWRTADRFALAGAR